MAERYVYTRDKLMQIRTYSLPVLNTTILCTYNDIINNIKRKRKRGRRGGVKQRLKRRGFKPPLPSIILSNVRSLRNKIDTLTALSKFDNDYKYACLICLTETWLTKMDNDDSLNLNNFTLFRGDRDNPGKSKGGGLCVYVNERWCKTVTVNKQDSTPDLELLSLRLRPHYLPREFKVVNLVMVYIPPNAKSDRAKQLLDEHASSLLQRHPDSPLIIAGDFNHCQLPVAGLNQYVTCKTRRNNTLDLCYCNIKNAFKAKQKQPVATSDHNTIHLIPSYKSKLKSEKPTIARHSVWSPEAIQRLNACFDCTDWEVLMPEEDSIDNWTEVVTDYVNFCVDLCVEKKEVKIFPNNKPWVTKRLKSVLNEKKIAFMSGDIVQVSKKGKEVRRIIKEDKLEYKNKMEKQLRRGCPLEAWQMIRQMGGVEQKKCPQSTGNTAVDVNELNDFYCRFNSNPLEYNVVSNNSPLPPDIEEQTVSDIFQRCKERKAPGPDKITGRILKTCHQQLAIPFTRIFQRSLNESTVPMLWKTSTVVPIAKKRNPEVLNDYRPVALTSLIIKCFEKIIKCETMQTCYDRNLLDPCQFSYQHSLSVEDALLTVIHTVNKHLDQKPSNHARILYVDFSSAFNAMNTQTLLNKMCQMGFQKYLIQWYQDFLTNRLQHVKLGKSTSTMRTVSNGCPQGCVTSPLLFILYTNDCRSSTENCSIIKYADDTAILGLITDQSTEKSYMEQVDRFVVWCEENHLQLNVQKTKEQIFTNKPQEQKDEPHKIKINDNEVEIVNNFKYLGVTISDTLNFKEHVENVSKKVSQRMYILRKLRTFEVSRRTMVQVYKCMILSVISFGSTVWFGGCGVKEKTKISKFIREASKIINLNLKSFDQLYLKSMERKAFSIVNNKNHILYPEFSLLPSGRRYLQAKCRTNRYKMSFVPSAIKVLNSALTENKNKGKKQMD